jgi:hypothetical protein
MPLEDPAGAQPPRQRCVCPTALPFSSNRELCPRLRTADNEAFTEIRLPSTHVRSLQPRCAHREFVKPVCCTCTSVEADLPDALSLRGDLAADVPVLN